MLRKTNGLDLAKLHQAMGGKLGEGVPFENMILYLLGMGLSVHEIGPWDNQEFIRRGFPYVRKFFGSKWSGELQTFWTPERVAAEQLRKHAAVTRTRHYGAQYQHTVRVATIQDVQRFLREDYVLPVILDLGEGELHHVLLYELHSKRKRPHTHGTSPYVMVYYPDDPSEIMEISLDDLTKGMCFQDFLAAVRL
jgi:hypothetical protein